MRLPRTQTRRLSGPAREAVILFAVSGVMFAIAATAVDEIRNSEGLQPLLASPLALARLAKVRYRLQRNRHTYYVVDAAYHFHLLPTPLPRLLILRRRPVAVLVERIDRMAEIERLCALPGAFQGEERRWYRGLALIADERGETQVVPVVNPEAFLNEADLAGLQRVPRAKGVTV